jgi:surfactin synthase thioesterase subunit
MTNPRWIVTLERRPAALLRLFCIPYAGCGAWVFRTWPARLPAWVEPCAVQPPGREERLRETPFRRVAPLLDALLPEMEPHLDRPFALFGHSMGALLAFETAVRLEALGHRPAHVFLSGAALPQAPAAAPWHVLPPAALLARVHELGSLPDQALVNPELRDIAFPILQADLELVETHVVPPSRVLRSPVTAFAGGADRRATPAAVAGWRAHTQSHFELILLPGRHNFIDTERDAVSHHVSQQLALSLEAVSAS